MKLFPKTFTKRIVFSIIISGSLLAGCASEKRVVKLDKVQTQYKNAVSLNERYTHGDFGEPDPASFKRLKQYRYDAYQSVMDFRKQFDKTKPVPQVALENAKQKINIYVSYLNALGATTATKDTFTGF